MLMKITLLGWMNYDNTIFNDLVAPAGIDAQTMIDSILMRCGEFNIIYSNAEFLKFAIKNWSERHKYQFEQMINALAETYDPLYNYDRHEEYTDNRQSNTKTTGTTNSSSKDSRSSAGSVENTISADNSSTYQPDNKSTDSRTDTGSATVDGSTTGNNDYTDKLIHNAHLYGNIGVTTSQQMLESEIVLREKFGIYDIIAASFAEEFCIMIY